MLSTVTLNILASCQTGNCLNLSSPGLFNFGSFGVGIPSYCAIALTHLSNSLVVNFIPSSL